MSLPYTLVRTDDDRQVISVFIDGQIYVAMDDHPNFAQIIDTVEGRIPFVNPPSNEKIADLFDVSPTVAARFDNLSERVSVAGGHVYFDGDELDNSLTKQILRFLDEGAGFMPLVRFLENLMQNPEQHSRENLYRWLDAADFTIDKFGDIVGYKGIAMDGDVPVSIHSGRAIVDGEVKEGRIPNEPGSIIEMPRSGVQFDPSLGCSYGLHVGTWDYAHSFGNGGVLEVRVNPRDVVSVPTDSGDQKMRVCRYEVIALITAPYTNAYLDDPDDEDESGWGDGEDDIY